MTQEIIPEIDFNNFIYNCRRRFYYMYNEIFINCNQLIEKIQYSNKTPSKKELNSLNDYIGSLVLIIENAIKYKEILDKNNNITINQSSTEEVCGFLISRLFSELLPQKEEYESSMPIAPPYILDIFEDIANKIYELEFDGIDLFSNENMRDKFSIKKGYHINGNTINCN